MRPHVRSFILVFWLFGVILVFSVLTWRVWPPAPPEVHADANSVWGGHGPSTLLVAEKSKSEAKKGAAPSGRTPSKGKENGKDKDKDDAEDDEEDDDDKEGDDDDETVTAEQSKKKRKD